MIAKYLSDRFVKLSLDGNTYPKLRLGSFFRLRLLRTNFFDSVKKIDKELFKQTVREIIELQTKSEIKEIDDLHKVLVSVFEIFKFNEFENPPVALIPPPKNPKIGNPDKKGNRWEYVGQYMAEWINYFAGTYGWSLEEILDLDIDIAGYLLQEIFIDDQFKKEWEYNLSELAYQYDSNSKKSTHKPLKRPYWMNNAVDAEIKKVKLLRSMLPVGVIIDLTGAGIVSANDENTQIIEIEETG